MTDLEELSYLELPQLRRLTVKELRTMLKPFARVSTATKAVLIDTVFELTSQFRLDRLAAAEPSMVQRPAEPLPSVKFLVDQVTHKLDRESPKTIAEDIWTKLVTHYPSILSACQKGYEVSRNVIKVRTDDKGVLFKVELNKLIAPFKTSANEEYRVKVNKAATSAEDALTFDTDDVFKCIEMVKTIIERRHSATRNELILALGLLTGRRTAEVIKTARFEQVDEYHVEFTGQIKTNDHRAYVIRTLAPSQVVIEMVDRLKELLANEGIETLTVDKVNSKYASTLRKTLKGYCGLKVHDLRKVYAVYLSKTMPETDRLVNYYVARNLYPVKPGEAVSTVVNSYIAADLDPTVLEKLGGLV